jgi:hypothetical protein
MLRELHEAFRTFGGLSLVSMGAIAIGEAMVFVENSALDLLEKRRDRKGPKA